MSPDFHQISSRPASVQFLDDDDAPAAADSYDDDDDEVNDADDDDDDPSNIAQTCINTIPSNGLVKNWTIPFTQTQFTHIHYPPFPLLLHDQN